MALAIAQKLYGPIGLTLTALVMTLVIIPINLYNIGVLVWFGGEIVTSGASSPRSSPIR